MHEQCFLHFLPLWVVVCWLLLYRTYVLHIRHGTCHIVIIIYFCTLFFSISASLRILYSVHLLWFYILFSGLFFAGFAATEIMCYWNIICMRNIRSNVGRTFAHQLIRFTASTYRIFASKKAILRSNFLFRFCMSQHIYICIYSITFALALDVECSKWCVHRNRQREKREKASAAYKTCI